MGSFNFKNDDPDLDLLIHTDAGGTVDGIDILFDSFQDETLAENQRKFQDWYLKELGIQPSGIGATYALDTGTDTFTVQLRKSLGLYDIEKMVNFARVLKYVKDQTKIDKVAASETLVDALNDYAGDRLAPAADFVTRNVSTDDPIMNFTLMTEIAGTNAAIAYRELFETYARNVVGEVLPASYITYTLAAEFSVEFQVGQSDALNELFFKLAASLHASPLVSWYDACLGESVGPSGLKAIVA